MHLKIFLPIYFFVFSLIGLYAQTDKDSLDLSANSYSNKLLDNSINKELNTYNFSTKFTYNLNSHNMFLGIKEIYNSTITKATSKNIKDEQYLKLFGSYSLLEQLKLGLFLNNYIYSDDRSLAINRVSNNNASFFVKFLPINKIEITPYAGLSNNNQIGETDNGFIYGSDVNIDNLELNDFEMSSVLRFQNEDISPRKNTLRLINVNVNSSFQDNLSNNISAYFINQRRDFYFAADESTVNEFNISNNIQSRMESNYALEDNIKFMPSDSPLSLNLTGRASWRNIERTTRYISLNNLSGSSLDSRIQEFKIDFLSSANYHTEDLDLSLKFSFNERDEKHFPRKINGLSQIIYDERETKEAQKNNVSQLSTISIAGVYNLSDKDRLTLSVFHRKLKYDTPSDLNYDDRDELLSIGRILYERKFNRFLNIFVNLEGNFNKTVYIFSERSSNNNIQRIIKLSSGGTITIGDFQTLNSAEVSANYTVYDFEELNTNIRSYSFRQFVYRDSTIIKLKKNLRLLIAGYIKLSEQSDLNWSSFSSKPLRYLNERYAEPKIYYDFSGLSFGIGIRYFVLSNFNIINGTQKEKVSEYQSIGPIAEINYTLSNSISFRTYGWYEFINSENGITREQANFNLKLLFRL